MSAFLNVYIARFVCFGFCVVCLWGCSTTEVRVTEFTPTTALTYEIPDEYLLDVGVEVFAVAPVEIDDDALELTSLRNAEALWVAENVKRTLQDSNAWGMVRVVPDSEVFTDLTLSGELLRSNGQMLEMHVEATDSSGKVWLSKNYTQQVSQYAYDPIYADNEPFQGLYNQLSDDLVAVMLTIPPQERAELRRVTQINFAKSFSPESFDQYLVEDENGHLMLDRLPAETDPMLARVSRIRERDQMFVDMLQDYYTGFTHQMSDPYDAWRIQSYKEIELIEDLESEARARKIGGWIAIAGGVAGLLYNDGNAFDDDSLRYYASTSAIYAGLENIKAGYSRADEAKLHIQTLSELGQSIELEIEPNVVEMQDRTVTLTGSVRNQYAEWKEILREAYYQETGYQRPVLNSDEVPASNKVLTAIDNNTY